jgi:hypothetical protein
MFTNCFALTTIYVGDGWDMSKVTNSGGMFTSCSELKGGNGTTLAKIKENEGMNVVDKTYARVDTAENPGYLTYKPAESTTPEQN